MPSDGLKRAIAENDEIDAGAKRLVDAFSRCDEKELGRAIDSGRLDLIASALGLPAGELDAMVGLFTLQGQELARSFPELNELVGQRQKR